MNFNRALVALLLVAVTMTSCTDQMGSSMRRARAKMRTRRQREETAFIMG